MELPLTTDGDIAASSRDGGHGVGEGPTSCVGLDVRHDRPAPPPLSIGERVPPRPPSVVSLRGEQRRSVRGRPGRAPGLRLRPPRASLPPPLALRPLRQRGSMDGPGAAGLARIPAHRLPVHGRPRRLRPLGTADGAGPVHRHPGRPHASRTRADCHPVPRPRHGAGAGRGLRRRPRRLRAAGGARDALRRAVGARLPGPPHRALRAGGPAPRGHRGLARDGLHAGGQDGGPGAGRHRARTPRARAVLRGRGRSLRGGPPGLRGAARAHRRPGPPRHDLDGGQPRSGLPRGLAPAHRPGGADRHRDDERGLLPLSAHAAGVRPRGSAGGAGVAGRPGGGPTGWARCSARWPSRAGVDSSPTGACSRSASWSRRSCCWPSRACAGPGPACRCWC